jgi:hypothetical protein
MDSMLHCSLKSSKLKLKVCDPFFEKQTSNMSLGMASSFDYSSFASPTPPTSTPSIVIWDASILWNWSNHPLCKHNPIHFLALLLTYKPFSLFLVDQSYDWHLSMLMKYHLHLFNKLSKCFIITKVVAIAIFSIARPK